MALMRFVLATAGLALVAPQEPAVPNVLIDHKPVDCVLAGQPPVLNACFTPPEEIVRARVYYRLGEAGWQFVPLVPEGSCFGAVLPRPARTDVALRYYLEAVDLASQSTKSSEYRALVVQDQNACAGVMAAVRPGSTAVASAGKKKTLPFILIGAGAAGAGVALAGGGGGGGGTDSTFTTSLPATVSSTIVAVSSTTPESTSTTVPGSSTTTTPGSSSTTTTSTTLSSSTTTTLPGSTTTTTLPGSTTTTTTLPGTNTTTTTTTSTTTTTLPQSTTTTTQPCTYALDPALSPQFQSTGGSSAFTLTTGAACAWNLDRSDTWATPNVTSGSGTRVVSYDVAGNLLGMRTMVFSVSQAPGTQHTVRQNGLLRPEPARPAPTLTSDLAVAGGTAQIVWDGASVTYAAEGTTNAGVPLTAGTHRVEAQLVAADGKPGTWRFAFSGASVKGLRPQSGKVEALAPDSITFRLSGRPGERVVFVFETES
jgi:hypothetical protein